MSLNILHLSDLHFGALHHWGSGGMPRLEKSLINAFKLYPSKIDLIIISGDLTSKGKEYHLVQHFLIELLKHNAFIGLRDIIIVPGNHDYPFEYENKEIISVMTEREQNYRLFIDNIYNLKIKLNNYNSLTIKPIEDIFKQGLDEHLISISSIIQEEDKCIYSFIGMNSMKIDSKNDRGKGFFGFDQLSLISDIGKYCEQKFKGYEHIIIAICHHHLVPVAFEKDYFEIENGITSKRTSITLDARRALKTLQKIGCRMILHGHNHQPSCITWRDRFENNPIINIVAAGSIGVQKHYLGDISRNHFYIHKISKFSSSTISFLTDEKDESAFKMEEEFSTKFYWPHGYKPDEDCILAHVEPEHCNKFHCSTVKSGSNLYFLFLNVINCNKTRQLIREFQEHKGDINVKICAMYDLYGRFDTVVKYREFNTGHGKSYRNRLIDFLTDREDSQVRELTPQHCLDIQTELYDFNDTPFIILPNEAIYEKSRWTCGFIEVPLISMLPFNKLYELLRLKLDKENILIANIIKGIYIADNDSILFELKMSCNQFHYMNKFSRILESIIDIQAIDKSTHIAYSHEEFLA
ncbi:MAG: metallophosphoesterase family protein [Desulfobaccales bacterium]